MKDWLTHPVTWGILTTVVIVGFGFWLGSLESCNDTGACQSKFAAFLVAGPNEVGDTLAGFAGALAFVWIIVTAWLQSQELAEQRKELRLTRLEMGEQRKASQDMARAMNIQADIFLDEQRQRDELRAEMLLNEKLRSLVVAISESGTQGLVWHYSNDIIDDEFGSHGEITSRSIGNPSDENKTIDEAMLALHRRLSGMYDDLWDLLHMSVGASLPKRTELISEIVKKAENIIAMKDDLSFPQQERLSRMRLGEIVSYIKGLDETPDFWKEH